MAYDDDLADRIRGALGDVPSVIEKRMFGGLAFLVNGHLAVAASGQGGLMLRVDPHDLADLLAEQHTGPMVMRGREMEGWMRVEAGGLESDRDLQRWIDIGVTRAGSLPPK